MKSLLVVSFFAVFLPQIIYGTDSLEALRPILDSHGANINGVLHLSPGSFLGQGGYGLVYRGVRIIDSRPVAIKFIESRNLASAEREYTIYTYLNAIDNPNVERFGILAVYYYAGWYDFIVIATTLCNGGNLVDNCDDFDLEIPLNNLIVFQQFVRQSKYIHSCGIRHDDIKPENIMLRSYQSFLIDFGLSSEMKKDTRLCTMRYKPRRTHCNQRRKAIDDWESFFFAMCQLNEIEIFDDEFDEYPEPEQNQKYFEAKNNVHHVYEQINAIESIPLRNAFLAFANEIYSSAGNAFPNYDWVDQFITNQISIELNSAIASNQPVFFTWMDSDAIEKAKKRIRRNPIPNIQTEIIDPREFNFRYPRIDVNHFNGTSAGSSSRS